jgi:hypothetical protein
MRIKAAAMALAQLRLMDPDPNTPIVATIEGARPEARHPLRRIWRGLGEVALFFAEAAVAVFEVFFRPKPGRSRRRKPRPVEKAAPFPVND